MTQVVPASIVKPIPSRARPGILTPDDPIQKTNLDGLPGYSTPTTSWTGKTRLWERSSVAMLARSGQPEKQRQT